MEYRELKYRIDWGSAWRSMRSERMKKLMVTYDSNFLERYADDYSKQIKSGNYEFGRKAVSLLEMLKSNFEVLEIGPGPGTLTIPAARAVKRVVGIELSKLNIKHLRMNLAESGIKNVTIINRDWEEIDTGEISGRFDAVVCSHFLWQAKNIEALLRKMENASRKYCILVQPSGRDRIVGEIFERISNEKYKGEFEPDADYFAYVILREWGRLVNVRHFDYIFERSLEEEMRVVVNFIGRFVEVDELTVGKIKDYLYGRLKDNRYKEKNQAVVMWWQCDR